MSAGMKSKNWKSISVKYLVIFLVVIILPFAIGALLAVILNPNDNREASLLESSAISTAAITPNSLEALINIQRASNGLSPLSASNELKASSCAKADHMLAQSYWAHTSPDGVTPWTFIEKAGYRYTTAGENLAKSYPDDASLVAAWMNSPSHRENVLGDFREQGICHKAGTLQGKTTTVTVQHVGVRS